jgi:hypothetical protein
MKSLFMAAVLTLGLPSIAHAAEPAAGKMECCEKMKREGKECCCEEKAGQERTGQGQTGPDGHESHDQHRHR